LVKHRQKTLRARGRGTLEAGGTKLRLLVTVTKSDTGVYAGKLDSLDQGATVAIDTITVNGDAVRWEIKSPAVAFEGVLNKERTELTGKFTQGGEPIPLTLKRSEQAASTISSCRTPTASRATMQSSHPR